METLIFFKLSEITKQSVRSYHINCFQLESIHPIHNNKNYHHIYMIDRYRLYHIRHSPS